MDLLPAIAVVGLLVPFWTYMAIKCTQLLTNDQPKVPKHEHRFLVVSASVYERSKLERYSQQWYSDGNVTKTLELCTCGERRVSEVDGDWTLEDLQKIDGDLVEILGDLGKL